MTPLLVLVFGVAPQTAVGTDLLFAALTKVFGTVVHHRQGTVDWPVVRRLALGSLPAAAATLAWMTLTATAQVRGGYKQWRSPYSSRPLESCPRTGSNGSEAKDPRA